MWRARGISRHGEIKVQYNYSKLRELFRVDEPCCRKSGRSAAFRSGFPQEAVSMNAFSAY